MKKIIGKILGLALFFVIIVSIGLGFWKGLRWSFGFLSASAWSIVNFTLTVGLLDIAMLKKSKQQLSLYLFIKFPVLYLAGFAVLVSQFFPIMSILSGLLFSTALIGAIKLWPKKA